MNPSSIFNAYRLFISLNFMESILRRKNQTHRSSILRCQSEIPTDGESKSNGECFVASETSLLPGIFHFSCAKSVVIQLILELCLILHRSNASHLCAQQLRMGSIVDYRRSNRIHMSMISMCVYCYFSLCSVDFVCDFNELFCALNAESFAAHNVRLFNASIWRKCAHEMEPLQHRTCKWDSSIPN